jgi:hypothetical protein
MSFINIIVPRCDENTSTLAFLLDQAKFREKREDMAMAIDVQ